MSGGYIFSIILNVILAVIVFFAIFFKDFINKYILHKVEKGEHIKTEEREVLKKLRSALYDYCGSFPLYIMNAVVYFKGDSASHTFIEPYFKESMASYNASEKKITELTPDINKDIRDRITSIRKEVAEMIIVASGSSQYITGKPIGLSRGDLISTSVATQGLGLALIADIEKLINK